MADPHPPGSTFAGFIIERELGSGGMGVVYLARHPRLPRHVALKLLRTELGADATFVNRFRREAETVAQLDHPNIVGIDDAGAEDGDLWISMRYIDGTTADRALLAQQQGMRPDRAVHIVEKVAAALDFAHRHGVVHRDVKPANILLADGGEDEPERVFLSDFGVAKGFGEFAAEETALTRAGNVVATIDYASPEQIMNKPLDGRSDQFALGCVLYKLLVGFVPYPGDNLAAKVYARLHKPPPLPSEEVPYLPRGFDAVVARALAQDPADRFPSCRALAAAARAALDSAPGPVPPTQEIVPDPDRTVHVTQFPPSGPVTGRPLIGHQGSAGATGAVGAPSAAPGTGPGAPPSTPIPAQAAPYGPTPGPPGLPSVPYGTPEAPQAYIPMPSRPAPAQPGFRSTGPPPVRYEPGPGGRPPRDSGTITDFEMPGSSAATGPRPVAGPGHPDVSRRRRRRRSLLVVGTLVVVTAVIVGVVLLLSRTNGVAGGPTSGSSNSGTPSAIRRQTDTAGRSSTSASQQESSSTTGSRTSVDLDPAPAITLPRAAGPLPPDQLLVSGQADGRPAVFAVSADGTAKALGAPGHPVNPVLSADRRTVLLALLTGGTTIGARTGIQQYAIAFVAAAATTGQPAPQAVITHIDDCPAYARPAWNPKRQGLLAFVCTNDDGTNKIILTDLKGNELGKSLPTGGLKTMDDISFSPDGTAVAFWGSTQTATGSGQIYTESIDGRSPPQSVTPDDDNGADPVWGPTNRIAYSSGTDSATVRHIVVISPTGDDKPVDLTSTFKQNAQGPTWSPDGKELAFKTQNQLFLIADLGAPAPKALAAKVGAINGTPSWSDR